MRYVRVDPVVRQRVEVVGSAVDGVAVDHITDRWMTDNGVQEGDVIQAFDIYIYGMDDTAPVWVVVTRSGLVLTVAEPPVGRVLPMWPVGVNRIPQEPALPN